MSIKFKKVNNIKIRIVDGEEEVLIWSKHLEESIEYINLHSIKSIDITGPGYDSPDIEFLKRCPHIESVSLDSSSLNDISGLRFLTNLKTLSITESVTVDGKNKVDLSLIPNIETLYIHWTKYVTGFDYLLNLKKLVMWKYAPKAGDIQELAVLHNLEALVLTQGKIRSLSGIESLKNLRELGLNYLRTLTTIDGIQKLQSSLQTLDIDCCKNIQDIPFIRFLTSLEVLKLCKSGSIESLNFLEPLAQLKLFVFPETNLVDGNINPCLHIDYVYFDNKKHYSHKWSSIEKWAKQVESNIV